MVVWSAIRRAGSLLTNTLKNESKNAVPSGALVPVREMSGGPRKFYIVPSKYTWLKFKDMAFFYICVGAAPWIVVITYVNIFIGPAKLAPIPEGYVPKEWEYYRHPITRWIAKYIRPTEQEEYEKQLNAMYEEEEKIVMQDMEYKVEQLMARKRDYKLFWHRPVTTKYLQLYKEQFAEIEDKYLGENVESWP